MKIDSSRRRAIFGATAATSLAALGWGRVATTEALKSDYRAIVCIFLNGGNDGNNTLIPLDSGYRDYLKARSSLALSDSELLRLAGSATGRIYGLHPACSDLVKLYNKERLAFIVNVGPIMRLTSVEQVLSGNAELPQALFSHGDQVDIQQGWQGNEEQSGWAGRALESLSLEIGDSIKGVTNNMGSILARGHSYAPAIASASNNTTWGLASLTDSKDPMYNAMLDLSNIKPTKNEYLLQYSRTLSSTLKQASELARAVALSKEPSTPFGSSSLDEILRHLAKLLPVFKQSGYQRQVFMVDWGLLIRTRPRGSNSLSQDSQLAVVSKAMGSFQTALDVAGLSENVTTFMMTEFSRTLMPATSNGSDHAWGNHFWVMGGRVRGGTVYGEFPDLVLGGKDDCDEEKEGRFVPTIATDQYGATLLNWLGISSQGIARAFPNLGNFPVKDLGFMA